MQLNHDRLQLFEKAHQQQPKQSSQSYSHRDYKLTFLVVRTTWLSIDFDSGQHGLL